VVEAFRPRYDPAREKPDSRFFQLARRPYPAQADAGEGLVRVLRERRSATVVGECGVGKTLLAAAVPWVLKQGRPYRVLVMCPNHLVRKWKREVEETVPGARARILSGWREVLALRDLPRRASCPEYYILARDTAKLGFFWKPGAVWRRGQWWCPDCGKLLVDKDGVPFASDEFEERRKRNLKCPRCGASLWQADNSKVRKVAPADVIKKYVKRRKLFQFMVGDEVHELKGDTAQGIAFGVLSGAAEKTLVLTGTLLNGYASSLHYILHRLDPDALVKEGIGYGEVQKWVERYGVLEKVTKTSAEAEYNWSSRGKKPRVTVKEKPGVSPLLFLRHLLDSTVFVELADLGCSLPEYREEVRLVEMDPELRAAYGRFAGKLRQEVTACLHAGSKRLLGTYLQNLLSYPDRPWDNPPVVDPKDGQVVADPPELPKTVRPKEEALLALVREELSRGRRVFVYVTYTQRRDITARLRELLESAGIRVAVLTADVPPVRREEWLEEKCLQGAQVVVAQARLVETGLDLTGVKNAPTLIFYQTGYNLYTLRQASRRSWRIGQTEPVKVVFLAYRNTLQETALQLMGSKLEAALLLEGKFTAEGLLALSAGEDMTAELARALVQGLEGVDSAEAIWRRVSGLPVEEKERAVELIALSDFFRKRRKRGSGPGPVQLGFSFLLSPELAAGGKR
ncbi:MAG: DEAD/DEAH box helicase, partial [Bacillota bacterium]